MQDRSEAASDVTASPSANGSWSTTGTGQEEATAASIGVATAPGQDADETVTDLPTSADEDRSTFLSELAEAMQTIVSAERARVADETEARRQAWLSLAHTRDAVEVERLRTVATDDTKAIETWVEVETKRIQREGERRRKEVQEDLATNLAAHRSTFDSAIDRVERAIGAYRADVDQFFTGFDGVRNPVAIAGRATERPEFPELEPVPETVASQASAAAELEATKASAANASDDDQTGGTGSTESLDAVGVIDPDAIGRADETLPEPVVDSADGDGTSEDPAAEPVGAVARNGSSSSLLQTVPALRPMSSWLRRDPQGDEQITS
jgi:hypothetical protein